MEWFQWAREAKSNGYNGLEMVIKVFIVVQSLNGLVCGKDRLNKLVTLTRHDHLGFYVCVKYNNVNLICCCII